MGADGAHVHGSGGGPGWQAVGLAGVVLFGGAMLISALAHLITAIAFLLAVIAGGAALAAGLAGLYRWRVVLPAQRQEAAALESRRAAELAAARAHELELARIRAIPATQVVVTDPAVAAQLLAAGQLEAIIPARPLRGGDRG